MWLAPILQRLSECEDLAHLEKLRSVLKATVKGLMANASVQDTTLMAYVLSLLQDAEAKLEEEKKARRALNNSVAVWTTSAITKRTTSDGRAQLLVEPEVKLTGVDRNETERKKVNKNSKEELVTFALHVR